MPGSVSCKLASFIKERRLLALSVGCKISMLFLQAVCAYRLPLLYIYDVEQEGKLRLLINILMELFYPGAGPIHFHTTILIILMRLA